MRMSFAAEGARLTILGAVLVVLAACGPDTSSNGADAVSPPSDADRTVVAEGVSFDTAELVLAAGEETVVFFVNRDDVEHNIAIYPDSSAADPLFRGELIGKGTTTYRIPALEPGTYHFQCDPHAPIMNGTVVVDDDAP